MVKLMWSARRMALAKRLLQPGTTVLSSAVAIFTTLVLAASEDKIVNTTTSLAVDGAVAGCCFVHTALFALAGALESWDLLIMFVTIANFVLDFLHAATPSDELDYVQALIARIGSALAMVWVTEEVLLFRRYRLKEAVEQMESSAQTGVSELSGKASAWGRGGRGLAVSDMAALSPRSQAAAAGGMPNIAMLSRQASMSALPASARVRTEAFVPSMGSTIRRALQLLLRVSIGAIAIAQASDTFIARVSPLSATGQRLLFTCVAIVLLVAVTQLTLRHTLHRKVVQPVVALASLIERLGALPLPPTEEEEGKLQGSEDEGGGGMSGGRDGRQQGRASGISIGDGQEGGRQRSSKGAGGLLRNGAGGGLSGKSGRSGPNPARRTLRRSNSNTETFFDVVMATLPAKVSRRIRRLLTVLCTCTRGKAALVDCSNSARRSVTVCLRKMGYKVKRRKANTAIGMSLIASDNTFRVRETEVLRAYVRRMWKLVRLGFGEAGQRLVSTAIDLEGEWKDAAAGTKVDAVFGFCDVRSFTDLTECLQAEVLPFVNDLARVVHGDVHASGGAPNKNIGDAFLLVWKLPATPLQNNTAAVLNQQRAKVAAVAESVGLYLAGGAGGAGGGPPHQGKGLLVTASKRGSVVDWLKHNMLGVAGAGTTGATTATVPVTAISAGETGSTGQGGQGSALEMVSTGGPPSAGGTTTGPDGQPVKVNSKKSFSSSLKGLFRRTSGGNASGTSGPQQGQGNSRGSVPSVSSQKALGQGTSITGSRNSAGSLPDGAQRKGSVPDMPDLRAAERPAPPILAKYASVGSIAAWPGSPGSPDHHGLGPAASDVHGIAEPVIAVQDGSHAPPLSAAPSSPHPSLVLVPGTQSGASSSRQQSEGQVQVVEDQRPASLSPGTARHGRTSFSPMVIPLVGSPMLGGGGGVEGGAQGPYAFTVPGTVLQSGEKDTPMFALSSVGSAASVSIRPALDLPDLDSPAAPPPPSVVGGGGGAGMGVVSPASSTPSDPHSLIQQAIGYAQTLDRGLSDDERKKGAEGAAEVDVPLLVQPYLMSAGGGGPAAAEDTSSSSSGGSGGSRSRTSSAVPSRAIYRPSMEPVLELNGLGMSSQSAEEEPGGGGQGQASSTSTSSATGGVGVDGGGIIFVKIQGDKAVKSPALIPPGGLFSDGHGVAANRRQSFTQQLAAAGGADAPVAPPLLSSPPVYRNTAQPTGTVYVLMSPPAAEPGPDKSPAGGGGGGGGMLVVSGGRVARTSSSRVPTTNSKVLPAAVINVSRAALAEEVASRRRNTMNKSITGLPSSAFLSPLGGMGAGAVMHLPPHYPQAQAANSRRRSGSAASGVSAAPLYPSLPAANQGRVSSARSLQMEAGFALADGVDRSTATALSAPRADGSTAPTEYRQLAGVSLLATNALAAFLNIIIKIHAANMPGGALFTYRMHPRVKASHLWTGQNAGELDPFRIRAGFGLHIGWAVEGAIGSSIKVDASYLSPSVNVTARLESATRFYGVDLLISKAFAQCLSYDVVGLLRRIDRVKLKGVAEPTDLYTFDWDPRAGLELLVGKQAARALEREDARQAMGLEAGMAASSAAPTSANPGGALPARSPAFLRSASKGHSSHNNQGGQPFASPGGFGSPPVLHTGPSLNMADLTPAPHLPPSNGPPQGKGRRSSAAHPFARPVAMLMHSTSLTSVKEFAPGGLQDLGGGDAGSAIYGQEGLVTAAGPLPGPLGSWIARQPTGLGGPAMRDAASMSYGGGSRGGGGQDGRGGWLKKVVGQSRRWLGVPQPEDEDDLHSPPAGVARAGGGGGLDGTPFSTPGLDRTGAGQDWMSSRPGAVPVALGRAGGRKAGIRYVPPNAPGSGQEGGQLPVLGLGAMGLYGSALDQASDLRSLQRDAGDDGDDDTQLSPMTAVGRSWLSIPPKEGGLAYDQRGVSSAESEGGGGGKGGADRYGASQPEEPTSAGGNGAPTPSGANMFGSSAPARRAFHPTFLSLSDMAVEAYLGEYVTGCTCGDAPPPQEGGSSARDGRAAGDSVAVAVGGGGGVEATSTAGGKRTASRRRSSWGDEHSTAHGTHTHATRAADWGLARECALKALALHPYDGPLRALLNVIESQGVLDSVTGRMAAPPSWQGYRQLDSK